mmetsp:Transcript_89996/g.288627  ORF Transcript_89996/g.288627 Transcript_89996/m.288627 type:complete len:659 (+) Transcript_89996:51-2027(+)
MCMVSCLKFLFSGSMKPPAYEVKRTSHSVYRLRCTERTEIGAASNLPVKLVVFDFDECLTLVTLMTEDGKYSSPEQEVWAREVNFETPWVPGSRIEKLKRLFDELKHCKNGETRVLACLTRNGNANGVVAVINLMKAAGLDIHFSAIWALPYRPGRSCGAYLDDGKWHLFDPPLRSLPLDHKADVLKSVCETPRAWFPQLGGTSQVSAEVQRMANMNLAEVVLVDDQRSNFQSETGAKVLRYCKVARYDAVYREFGVLRDMGGIGAHNDADYDTLKRFVEDPWMCKDTYQVRCQEREFQGSEAKRPVSLVVFDFDETLTMATFMPVDEAFAGKIGWSPKDAPQDDWSEAELLEYNFESPHVRGKRVNKLKDMLKALVTSKDGSRRTLAILTKNDQGVIAVLNLLKIAGLAEFFSAIWTLPLATRSQIPNGVYRGSSGVWNSFEPPLDEVLAHKADVLHHVATFPAKWFPQLGEKGDGIVSQSLSRLFIESIVLVDDERANFRSESETQAKVLRYCKVARYDEAYRDCGTLNQMGGLGAHSDQDYETLKTFVESPWDYPYESVAKVATEPEIPMPTSPQHSELGSTSGLRGLPRINSKTSLCRDTLSEEPEPPKVPRIRQSLKFPAHHLDGDGASLPPPPADVPPAMPAPPLAPGGVIN